MQIHYVTVTMSAELHPRDGSRRSTDRSNSLDFETVLGALEDPDCRRILEATSDEPLTAGEIMDRCDVPRSTTYRKLEQLTEAGLLNERIRLSPDGKHASEYRRTVDDVTISLEGSDGVSIGHSSATATPEVAD